MPSRKPSKVFLQDSLEAAPGSVVSCTLEGSRAILFEAQALVNHTNYAVPQRVAAGIDPKRLTIILALLEKFGGLEIGDLVLCMRRMLCRMVVQSVCTDVM